MWSVKVVVISANLGVLGLDDCPPVQEDLDRPEEAFLHSPMEGSMSILSIHKHNYIHTYTSYIYVHTLPHIEMIISNVFLFV